MTRRLTLLPFALLLVVLPFPGTVALRLLCLATAALVAASVWWRYAERRPSIPCKAALLAWIGVAGISVLYSMAPAYSLGEFKNEIGYTMLAFVSFLIVARDRATVEHLALALAAGFGFIGLWALGGWAANGFSWDQGGRFGGTGVFSTYIVTVVPALFWLAGAASRPGRRAVAWALLTLAFLLAVLTQQRAIWPALAAELAVLAAWDFKRGFLPRRALLSMALGGVAMAGAFYAVGVSRSDGRELAAELAQDSRLPVWRGVAGKIAEHPVTGAGFGRGIMEYAYPELVPDANPLIRHPHNVFLGYALGMGIPGLAALAFLYISFGREFRRLQRSEDRHLALLGVCGVMLVVGIVVRNQFNDFFARDMALLYWALAGLFLGEASRMSGRKAI